MIQIMKYLDAVLRYFAENDFTHREDVAIIVSDIFEENPDVSLGDFVKRIKKVKRDFFRVNRLNRSDFAEAIYVLLNKVRKEQLDKLSKFTIAKNFSAQNFEVSFDTMNHIQERKEFLKKLATVKKPHTIVMKAFNQLLNQMQLSHQIDLHGVKEYSGIDISKSFRDATIGFQIKTRSDDISEHMIRSESSKAQDWQIDGFVLVYARAMDKVVETSIQAAYHHFKILNDSGRMYCAIVPPELLAELFRKALVSL